ncbi:cell division protein SepF [Fructilactobacillus lindneri]|uniref:Cell division protein SepF n=2 Tax=Fructilactobacillus lindneri TaxID=53444 RepID=A0A0R2JMF7_9LACO|nr:cell division protein SepF [Fructilactobacillus lindneri]KRN78361.1 hypothetical protein IV52_GL001299 [Fructilactobacillus lindneri DSM 20690 = JCM 11027]SKA01417.1 cell division inhibitor SepF [Fructilactobacillus lindneri DSM 20690 = JCM 11027]
MAKGILNNLFGFNEDADNNVFDQKNDVKNANPRKVLAMSDKRIPDSKINIVEPRIFADAKNIGNKLMSGNAVLMKMENVNATTIRRIVDFISGTVFAIDGNIQQIDDKVYLCTPKNYAIDGDVKQQLYDRPESKD